MALDAICLTGLRRELADGLVGAKIDKVQQPERDMLLLSLRTMKGNKKLLIAAGNGNARVHFTTLSFENPAEPPMFCMLLRKHIVGARIADVDQPEHERMLRLVLDTHDEMGDEAQKQLIVEMIGRSSNVILVGPDGRILDCMRRSDSAVDGARSLLPGMLYRLPPKQDKHSFFATSEEDRKALIAEADRTRPVDKWLLDTFSGLSPLLCRELSARSHEDYDTLSEQLTALRELIEAGDFQPTLLTEDGKPRDFSFLPIRQYGAAVQQESFSDFSSLLDAFYARYGMMENRLLNFDIAGAQPMQVMGATMAAMRAHPLAFLAGSAVETVKDYAGGIEGLPKSNVLSYATSDGKKAIVRPSGTEPKVKVYLSARAADKAGAEAALDAMTAEMTEAIRKEA